MATMSTAEKVETIILAHLQHGTTAGALGTLVRVEEFGLLRVEADGLTVLARTDAEGWRVSFKGCEARGDLLEAARDALEAGQGRNVSSVAAALSIACPR